MARKSLGAAPSGSTDAATKAYADTKLPANNPAATGTLTAPVVKAGQAAVDDTVWYPGNPSIHGDASNSVAALGLGTSGAPNATDSPTAWIQRFTSVNQAMSWHFASGLLVDTVKTTGASAPNAGIISSHVTGGTGDNIGLQGRAITDVELGTSTTSAICTGIWAATATTTTPSLYTAYAGLEINSFNRWGSTTKKTNLSPGSITGLLVYNFSANPSTGAEDGTARPNHFGILLGGNVAGQSYHTGILVDGIINEGIRFEGNTKVGDANKAGIVFNDAYQTTGIRFDVTLSSSSGDSTTGTAIDVGPNKIHLGTSPAWQWNVGDLWRYDDAVYFRINNGGTPMNAELMMSRGVQTKADVAASRRITVYAGGALYNLLAVPYNS